MNQSHWLTRKPCRKGITGRTGFPRPLRPGGKIFSPPPDPFARAATRYQSEDMVMQQQLKKTVRIIKRGQRAGGEGAATPADKSGTQSSERELRAVVSGWVREHRQRAEEGRRAAAFMLKAAGFGMTPAA